MKMINDGLKFTSIRSIEVTLLLAIHSMRSPSGSSVWHLSGLAIRQCLELGLHKQRNMDARYNSYIQHRKCIFWSAYIFERKTSLVLGRPFALSDEEIDVDMPFNVSDDQDEDKNLAPVAQSSPLIESPERTTLSYHRAHIQLYQIHTKLRLVLHQMKRSKTKDEVKEVITTLFARLEDWRTQVLDSFDTSQASSSNSRNTRRRQASPDNDSDSSNSNPDVHLRPVEVEKAELLLEYYKARRSLLQPLMTDGRDHYPFDKSDYIACADASGQICQLHRRLHRLSPIPFSLRDLHAVFVAGFTLIYCICSCPEIYSASRASDIGACSTVLYVITEQWPSAKKYRDAFELVAEKMMESTRDPGLENPMIAGGRGDFDGHVQPHGNPSESIAVASVSAEYHAGTAGSFPPRSISIAGILNSDVFFHSDAEAPSSSGLGLDLDLESDLYDIEGLLTNEGLDWFTGATI
ncbi:hypothetical protein GQ53DRAFT_745106 [Thozetella sp. PMI_491]|nr:hypothetical protein GQ53DRAFT_745106 [Thozetella sp. PMI_491]